MKRAIYSSVYCYLMLTIISYLLSTDNKVRYKNMTGHDFLPITNTMQVLYQNIKQALNTTAVVTSAQYVCNPILGRDKLWCFLLYFLTWESLFVCIAFKKIYLFLLFSQCITQPSQPVFRNSINLQCNCLINLYLIIFYWQYLQSLSQAVPWVGWWWVHP